MKYFDANATARLAPEAQAAWLKAQQSSWANPSALHSAGSQAHTALEQARETFAALLQCEPRELLFNSGATEAHNTLFASFAQQARSPSTSEAPAAITPAAPTAITPHSKAPAATPSNNPPASEANGSLASAQANPTLASKDAATPASEANGSLASAQANGSPTPDSKAITSAAPATEAITSAAPADAASPPAAEAITPEALAALATSSPKQSPAPEANPSANTPASEANGSLAQANKPSAANPLAAESVGSLASAQANGSPTPHSKAITPAAPAAPATIPTPASEANGSLAQANKPSAANPLAAESVGSLASAQANGSPTPHSKAITPAAPAAPATIPTPAAPAAPATIPTPASAAAPTPAPPPPPPAGVAISAIEHASVLEPAQHYFQKHCTLLPVDAQGRLQLDALPAVLKTKPALISIMAANNETGVLQPWAEVLKLCRAHGIPLHVDASQCVGKESLAGLGQVDFLSLSAHKFGGPKGVGLLKLPADCELMAKPRGGHQELKRRAGTEDIAAIAAAAAAASARSDLKVRATWLAGRRLFERHIRKAIPKARINGLKVPRLANTVSLTMPLELNTRWVARLDKLGFAVATGSACMSEAGEPSRVLGAMALSPEAAARTIRISADWGCTPEDWSALAEAIVALHAAFLKEAESSNSDVIEL